MAIFQFLFFLVYVGQKNVFYDILERKYAFLGYKTKKFKKSKKIDTLLKGLTHGFRITMAIFRTFFFRQNRPGKCFLRYSTKKKRLCRLKKQKFTKSKNSHFSEGVNPWFWSNTGHFSNFFFLGNIGQKNVFYDIIQQKTSFYSINTRS